MNKTLVILGPVLAALSIIGALGLVYLLTNNVLDVINHAFSIRHKISYRGHVLKKNWTLARNKRIEWEAENPGFDFYNKDYQKFWDDELVREIEYRWQINSDEQPAWVEYQTKKFASQKI